MRGIGSVPVFEDALQARRNRGEDLDFVFGSLRAAGLDGVFGVAMLHRHFSFEPGERLLSCRVLDRIETRPVSKTPPDATPITWRALGQIAPFELEEIEYATGAAAIQQVHLDFLRSQVAPEIASRRLHQFYGFFAKSFFDTPDQLRWQETTDAEARVSTRVLAASASVEEVHSAGWIAGPTPVPLIDCRGCIVPPNSPAYREVGVCRGCKTNSLVEAGNA